MVVDVHIYAGLTVLYKIIPLVVTIRATLLSIRYQHHDCIQQSFQHTTDCARERKANCFMPHITELDQKKMCIAPFLLLSMWCDQHSSSAVADVCWQTAFGYHTLHFLFPPRVLVPHASTTSTILSLKGKSAIDAILRLSSSANAETPITGQAAKTFWSHQKLKNLIFHLNVRVGYGRFVKANTAASLSSLFCVFTLLTRSHVPCVYWIN